MKFTKDTVMVVIYTEGLLEYNVCDFFVSIQDAWVLNERVCNVHNKVSNF